MKFREIKEPDDYQHGHWLGEAATLCGKELDAQDQEDNGDWFEYFTCVTCLQILAKTPGWRFAP